MSRTIDPNAITRYIQVIDGTATPAQAEQALQEAAATAKPTDRVSETYGRRRWRAVDRRHAPWARCYLWIGEERGTVFDVEPAHGRTEPAARRKRREQ